MRMYCLKCGQPTTYTIDKPNYCASCGEAFASTNKRESSKTSVSIPKSKVKRDELQEEETETTYDLPPDFKLEIEPLPRNLRGTETFRSIAFDKNPKSDLGRARQKKQSRKKFEEEWASEVKSSKNKSSQISE